MKNLIRKSFTQIPNDLINDATIDKSARFLFVYLCSKPDDWKYYNSELCKALNCSQDTLRKYMQELNTKGWISKIQLKKGDGTFGANDITLNAEPYPVFSDTVDFREREKTDAVKNRIGKTTAHNNTKENNNNKLFTDTEIIPVPHQIINYLNEKRGDKGFKLIATNFTHINARLKDNFTLDDFKKVVDAAMIKWGGDSENSKYIRPETLFGTKMNGYLLEAENVLKAKTASGSNNFVYEPMDEAHFKSAQ